MRSLKLGWVLVVDVGLGAWRLGSKNSVVGESRGMSITLLLSVWVEPMILVVVRLMLKISQACLSEISIF